MVGISAVVLSSLLFISADPFASLQADESYDGWQSLPALNAETKETVFYINKNGALVSFTDAGKTADNKDYDEAMKIKKSQHCQEPMATDLGYELVCADNTYALVQKNVLSDHIYVVYVYATNDMQKESAGNFVYEMITGNWDTEA